MNYMASQDPFQPHLLWFCAFVSDSLLNWQEVWGWPLHSLNLLGKMRNGRKRSSSSWVFPLDSFPPTCSSGEVQHHSVLNAFCACGGENDSISGWPNDKVFGLKIPTLSLIIPLSATMGSGHSLANATWTFNTFEYLVYSSTSLSSP